MLKTYLVLVLIMDEPILLFCHFTREHVDCIAAVVIASPSLEFLC